MALLKTTSLLLTVIVAVVARVGEKTFVRLTIRTSDLFAVGDDKQMYKCVVESVIDDKSTIVHTTDPVRKSATPEWNTFIAEFHFDELLRLKFSVFDCATRPPKFLGSAETFLADILKAAEDPLMIPALNASKKDACFDILLMGQEIESQTKMVILDTKAVGLPQVENRDPNPFLVIAHSVPESKVLKEVERTETIEKSIKPNWKKMEIPYTLLTRDINDIVIKFQVYHWDNKQRRKGVLLGEFDRKYSDIKHGEKYELKNGGRSAGTIVIETIKEEVFTTKPTSRKQGDTISDFIAAPLDVNCIFGIDFTGSNGNQNEETSLHFLNSKDKNQYTKAITSAGGTLERYDTDKKLPVFYFGGIPAGRELKDENAEHCYPMNGDLAHPEVESIKGVLDAYKSALKTVTLWGPTNFAPLIKYAADQASEGKKTDKSKYFILLIITDGAITDFDKTVEELYKAQYLPLSVVIVGVGTYDFMDMRKLDGDETPLMYENEVFKIDIVQFVDFKMFYEKKNVRYTAETNPANLVEETKLGKEVTQEIPDQILGYMLRNGITAKFVKKLMEKKMKTLAKMHKGEADARYGERLAAFREVQVK